MFAYAWLFSYGKGYVQLFFNTHFKNGKGKITLSVSFECFLFLHFMYACVQGAIVVFIWIVFVYRVTFFILALRICWYMLFICQVNLNRKEFFPSVVEILLRAGLPNFQKRRFLLYGEYLLRYFSGLGFVWI